jgi:hypothetical protein
MTIIKRTTQRLIEDDFLKDGDRIYILYGTKASIFRLIEHQVFGIKFQYVDYVNCS